MFHHMWSIWADEAAMCVWRSVHVVVYDVVGKSVFDGRTAVPRNNHYMSLCLHLCVLPACCSCCCVHVVMEMCFHSLRNSNHVFYLDI